MATPPTRVLDVTPTAGWASQTSPKTSPAFDVQAGDLLVYMAFSEDAGGPLGAPTWTGTGTWTLRQSIVVNNYCTAYLYTCDVTATETGRTVSVSRTSGTSQFSFLVSLWRDHGGVGVSGKANVANGAPSLVLNAAANSALVMGNSDWTATSGTSRTWRTVNGSPITESSYGGQAGVSYICYTGYAPDAGAAGNETVGLTAPTGQKYSIVGIEILGVAGSGFTGSVSFSASGTLSAAGSPGVSGALALSGSGTLSAAGAPGVAGSLGLSASGAMSLTAVPRPTGAVALSGSGVLSGSGIQVLVGSAALSATGTLAPSGTPNTAGAVALSGSGTLSAAGKPTTSGSVGLSGTGTLTLAGKPNAAGALALSGVGTLSAVGVPRPTGAVGLSGSGTLAGAGTPAVAGQLALSATGTLAGLVGGFAGAVGFSADGVLAAAGTPAVAGSVTFAGAGVLAGAGLPRFAVSLALSGSGTLAAVGVPRPTGAVALSAVGTLELVVSEVHTVGQLELSAAGELVGFESSPVGYVLVSIRPRMRDAVLLPRSRSAVLLPRVED